MGIAFIALTSTDFTVCLLQVANDMKELLNSFVFFLYFSLNQLSLD